MSNIKRTKLTDFVALLKLEIEMYGYALCILSDGSCHRVISQEADLKKGAHAKFRTLDWAFEWKLDGTSLTSSNFNIMEFEPQPIVLDSVGVLFRIERANLIQKKIDSLYVEIDELLDPVVRAAAETQNVDILKRMSSTLPSGFHRSELKTLINMLDVANSTLGPDTE